MALSLFGWRKKNPEEKAEMSFIEHLEVLRGHLFRSVLAIAAGAIVFIVYNTFFVRDVLMGPTHADFPTYKWLCKLGHAIGLGDNMCMKDIGLKMQSTSVSGQFSMYFTLIFVGGIIVAFPYIFWEFWRFIKPALTKKELSKTRGVIFWVSLLFFLGILFGYFVIAPYTVNFFANFQLDENIENRWTITSYIDTLVPLILGTGLAFQLPLVMFFLAKVGLMSPDFLRRNRKYAIVIILILAGIITPPDVISQIICTIPLWLLYEISIWLTAKVQKERELQEKEEWS
ncbi:MAG TPA: twin-arginine translocase subunit TatC [Chitinophagaceae bacterium]|jgi:sec-independent protein translocase protein TatC|nr:twin-arginine translocase subunit TatC [Chitinophagaceae bacterium]